MSADAGALRMASSRAHDIGLIAFGLLLRTYGWPWRPTSVGSRGTAPLVLSGAGASALAARAESAR